MFKSGRDQNLFFLFSHRTLNLATAVYTMLHFLSIVLRQLVLAREEIVQNFSPKACLQYFHDIILGGTPLISQNHSAFIDRVCNSIPK